jgi:hypothetical protein
MQTSPPSPPTAPARPLCIHCKKYKETRPRHLCRKCHQEPSIRAQYPPVSAHGRRMARFTNEVGPRPLPRKGTSALPGSEQKILELQQRVALGLNPWSPLDRPMDPEVDRWEQKPAARKAAPAGPPRIDPAPKRPKRKASARRPGSMRQLLLPFDPPLEDVQSANAAPACQRETKPSSWVRRSGVVVVRAVQKGCVQKAALKRAPAGQSLVATIHTDDREWLAAQLGRRWNYHFVPSLAAFRLPKEERAWVAHVVIWNKGQKPTLQRSLFEPRPKR